MIFLYSVPNVGTKWLPVDPKSENLNYLHIAGPRNLTSKTVSTLSHRDFWTSIDFNENKIGT